VKGRIVDRATYQVALDYGIHFCAYQRHMHTKKILAEHFTSSLVSRHVRKPPNRLCTGSSNYLFDLASCPCILYWYNPPLLPGIRHRHASAIEGWRDPTRRGSSGRVYGGADVNTQIPRGPGKYWSSQRPGNFRLQTSPILAPKEPCGDRMRAVIPERYQELLLLSS
jgi:hypothetical protein